MWRCPECKSDSLDVEVTTWARLYQTDEEDVFSTDHSEAEDCSHEWGNASTMKCRACGHSDKAAEFEFDPPVDTEGDAEPSDDDTAHACPECETPNQFGETCARCRREMEDTES